jgi:hypothetical protein
MGPEIELFRVMCIYVSSDRIKNGILGQITLEGVFWVMFKGLWAALRTALGEVHVSSNCLDQAGQVPCLLYAAAQFL